MRVLMLEAPRELLAQRRAWGGDKWDEMWDGVLHAVPIPSAWHQELMLDLLRTIAQLPSAQGLVVVHRLAVLDPRRPRRDYRVPDFVVAERKHVRNEGVFGPAKLVVELLVKGDETLAKLPFYAARGVEEVWLVDREPRTVEVLILRDGGYVQSLPIDGVTPTDVLGVTLETIAGPRLRLAWHGDHADV